jgi:hypothetical protein
VLVRCGEIHNLMSVKKRFVFFFGFRLGLCGEAGL